MSDENLELSNVDASFVDDFIDDIDEDQMKLQKTLAIRARIERASGDPLSLLGTTADGASLALILLAEVFAKLRAVNSIAELNEVVEPYAKTFEPFLARRTEGEAILTADVKGWESVLEDVQVRSTGVVSVLSGDRDV